MQIQLLLCLVLYGLRMPDTSGLNHLARGHLVCICATLCEDLSSGFPTRSNTNLAVQPQKMARGLKFPI